MKLSNVGALTALALLTACGPGGCGDEQTEEHQQRVRVYASVAECQADLDDNGARRHTDEDCSKAFEQAQEARKTGPQFSERAACEEKYNHCETRREGDHDVFMPFLEGVLVGHLLSGGTPTVVTQPVYVDRGGSAYAGSNRLGSYSRCNSRSDPSCGGSSSGGFGYVYGGAGGRSTGTGVWSGGSYTTQTVTAPAAPSRGGFGVSGSSVSMPSGGDHGSAMAPNASSGSSVARGGFGSTAATAASAGE